MESASTPEITVVNCGGDDGAMKEERGNVIHGHGLAL